MRLAHQFQGQTVKGQAGLQTGGSIPCRPNLAATLLVLLVNIMCKNSIAIKTYKISN